MKLSIIENKNVKFIYKIVLLIFNLLYENYSYFLFKKNRTLIIKIANKFISENIWNQN